MRDKPSTKAREISYSRLRSLFHLLDLLMISHPWFRGDNDIDYDYKGWRDWVVRHTPPDKRGGISESSKKKVAQSD